jgi:hypothetical protein
MGAREEVQGGQESERGEEVVSLSEVLFITKISLERWYFMLSSSQFSPHSLFHW